MIETETWQPGKVKQNKINTSHTYLATMNYWAPLQETDNEEQVEEIDQITTIQPTRNTKSNKWTRQIE